VLNNEEIPLIEPKAISQIHGRFWKGFAQEASVIRDFVCVSTRSLDDAWIVSICGSVSKCAGQIRSKRALPTILFPLHQAIVTLRY
jgi:hypothetical protein